MKRKNGFTLIELIAVLVILAILALIVTPLVMNIIRKAKISADRRSVDAYGRSVELAIATYLLDTGTFPTDLSSLKVEYTGKVVSCNVMQMKENGGIYLSECTVDGKQVKDDSTEDGYYHYGTKDITNEEYVDMYGLALKNASVAYYNTNDTIVEDYTTLTLDYKGKPVACEVTINYDGSIYMTECKVNNVDVTSDKEEDGYYHYGSMVYPPVVQSLISKANPATITNYTDGNIGEMYTFKYPATEQTGALTDYRYIGANPNNYVTFNNEMWRIIGVFTVEDENGNTEQRIKIVRNEKLPSNLAWNSNNVNEWTTASLNTYLNGEYYNGLDAASKSMIVDTKYYLGGFNNYNGSAFNYYNFERGTTVYSGRSTSWIGKIGLMYPSDNYYTYALGVDDTCYSNGASCYSYQNNGVPNSSWIYVNIREWFLSSYSNYSDYALYRNNYIRGNIINNGDLSISSSYLSYGVRPTMYLNSQVMLSSGDGSEQNPYQLSL